MLPPCSICGKRFYKILNVEGAYLCKKCGNRVNTGKDFKTPESPSSVNRK